MLLGQVTYKTSLDNLAKFITVSTTILFALIVISQILLLKDEVRPVRIVIAVTLPLAYLAIWLFRPINYSLTEDKLVIHRTLTDVKIGCKQIQSVEQIDKSKLKWTIRTNAVGGVFGYWGQFINSKIGRMTWYATRRDNYVLITTARNKRILLTPDEPEKFVAELTLMASRAANTRFAK